MVSDSSISVALLRWDMFDYFAGIGGYENLWFVHQFLTESFNGGI